MNKQVECTGCKGEFDAKYMVVQDAKTIYCPACDYENSAKLDNLTDEE